MLRRISTTVVLISSLGLYGCSTSAEGKYVLEGNDRIYLELKPIDAKNGTVSDSGAKNGKYILNDGKIYLTEASGEWIGLGYLRGKEIILSEYHGTRKEHRFVKQ